MYESDEFWFGYEEGYEDGFEFGHKDGLECGHAESRMSQCSCSLTERDGGDPQCRYTLRAESGPRLRCIESAEAGSIMCGSHQMTNHSGLCLVIQECPGGDNELCDSEQIELELCDSELPVGSVVCDRRTIEQAETSIQTAMKAMETIASNRGIGRRAAQLDPAPSD